MTNKFTKTLIPLWLALLLITIISGVAVIASLYFRKTVYERDLIVSRGDNDLQKFEYGSWPAMSSPDFFSNVKKEFANKDSDFIEANLSEMKLRVYEKGSLAYEINILSKGKEGSWWETPAGLYKIQNKEKDHYSSFGGVYQPWSMAFQGNFFIHGWPYYPDGRAVASTYSGGCIRLSTDNAQKIYDKVKIGTPILVFEEDFRADDFKYQVKIPDLSAKNYLAADLRSNFVFLSKSENQSSVPIASITKLMTALVATEYINLDKEIVVTKEMIVPTSIPRLKIGDKITVFQLLYPLLLESSNEAAVAISRALGENYFINLMNQKAEALGMKQTKFVDSSGSRAGNVSSTEDLFALAKYLYNNRSFILKISTGSLNKTAYGPSIFNLQNFNVFADNPEFIGGKVGLTEKAKSTMLAIFVIDLGEEKRPIAIIALGSENAPHDIGTILEHIKTNYERNDLRTEIR